MVNPINCYFMGPIVPRCHELIHSFFILIVNSKEFILGSIMRCLSLTLFYSNISDVYNLDILFSNAKESLIHNLLDEV